MDTDRPKWRFEDGGFLALVLLVSAAFAWLIWPFFGAVLWGVIAGIVFAPTYRRILSSLGGRRNLAAALLLVLILALVIIPALLLGISLIREAASIYVRLESGEIDVAKIFLKLREALPGWGSQILDSAGFSNLETARTLLGSSIASVVQNIAESALSVGQGALQLLASLGVMMFLTFFLLRDGDEIARKIRAAIPLRPDMRDALLGNFVVVIRATIRGTLVVSILQGTAGGLIFWILGIGAPVLWGMLMALFSLVPAVGTGIIWLPVAIYLLATGDIFAGVALIICGFLIIGLIDNVLRPILVGHETHMPEYVVLIATVSGLSLMGLNGVIVGPIIAALFIVVWKMVSERQAAERFELL